MRLPQEIKGEAEIISPTERVLGECWVKKKIGSQPQPRSCAALLPLIHRFLTWQ
jgi:hypothetical protein